MGVGGASAGDAPNASQKLLSLLVRDLQNQHCVAARARRCGRDDDLAAVPEGLGRTLARPTASDQHCRIRQQLATVVCDLALLVGDIEE